MVLLPHQKSAAGALQLLTMMRHGSSKLTKLLFGFQCIRRSALRFETNSLGRQSLLEEDVVCFWMTNVLELLDVEESGVEKAVCLVDNGSEEMNWYRGIKPHSNNKVQTIKIRLRGGIDVSGMHCQYCIIINKLDLDWID